jgi:Flp pilus assembly protein TadB
LSAVLAGLLVAVAASALAFVTVYARWAWRDRRRRRRRLDERSLWDDELERAKRRLRLKVEGR